MLIAAGRHATEKFIAKGPPKLDPTAAAVAMAADAVDAVTATRSKSEARALLARAREVASEIRSRFADVLRRQPQRGSLPGDDMVVVASPTEPGTVAVGAAAAGMEAPAQMSSAPLEDMRSSLAEMEAAAVAEAKQGGPQRYCELM
jgi:hypothetical protein